MARVFLAVGFATLERSRPEISEASYGKAESVLRALEEEILTVQVTKKKKKKKKDRSICERLRAFLLTFL